jgi:hemin uptake protein HemP
MPAPANPPASLPEPPAKAEGSPPPTYTSESLFQGGKVVLILHEGREYWLRITHANKLILTA